MDFDKFLQAAAGGSAKGHWAIGLVDSFFTALLYPFAFAMIVGTLTQLGRFMDRRKRAQERGTSLIEPRPDPVLRKAG